MYCNSLPIGGLNLVLSMILMRVRQSEIKAPSLGEGRGVVVGEDLGVELETPPTTTTINPAPQPHTL